MKIKKLLVASIISIMIFSSYLFYAQAAVGNHSGSSKSSSSSSRSSSSSSSSSRSSGSYGGTSTRTSGGSSGIGGLVVLIIIIAGVYYLKSKKVNINNFAEDFAKNMGDAINNNLNNNFNSQNVISKIHEKDPSFSESKFIEWSNEVFITLQQAWTKKDWKIIRPFECESLFRQHQLQLQEYIDQKKVNIVSNICITSSSISSFTSDEQYDYLTVKMSVNMHDYIMDEETKKIIERDPNETYYSNYELVYMRSIGVTTNASTSNMSTTNCPNCGAPTQITSAGECEYCHSVITTGQHDWVLCQLKCNE